MEWLEKAKGDFDLPDIGKAMRCLLVYVEKEVIPTALFGAVRNSTQVRNAVIPIANRESYLI